MVQQVYVMHQSSESARSQARRAFVDLERLHSNMELSRILPLDTKALDMPPGTILSKLYIKRCCQMAIQ
jgi:hypothetical protein